MDYMSGQECPDQDESYNANHFWLNELNEGSIYNNPPIRLSADDQGSPINNSDYFQFTPNVASTPPSDDAPNIIFPDNFDEEPEQTDDEGLNKLVSDVPEILETPSCKLRTFDDIFHFLSDSGDSGTDDATQLFENALSPSLSDCSKNSEYEFHECLALPSGTIGMDIEEPIQSMVADLNYPPFSLDLFVPSQAASLEVEPSTSSEMLSIMSQQPSTSRNAMKSMPSQYGGTDPLWSDGVWQDDCKKRIQSEVVVTPPKIIKTEVNLNSSARLSDSDDDAQLPTEEKTFTAANFKNVTYPEHNYSKIYIKEEEIPSFNANEDVDVESFVDITNPIFLKTEQPVVTKKRIVVKRKPRVVSPETTIKTTTDNICSRNVKKQLHRTITKKIANKKVATPKEDDEDFDQTPKALYDLIINGVIEAEVAKVCPPVSTTQGKPAAYAKRMQLLHSLEDENSSVALPKKRRLANDPDDDVTKRISHNHMERLRRVDLKNLFNLLRDAISELKGNTKASKVTILLAASKICNEFFGYERKIRELEYAGQQLQCKLNSMHSRNSNRRFRPY